MFLKLMLVIAAKRKYTAIKILIDLLIPTLVVRRVLLDYWTLNYWDTFLHKYSVRGYARLINVN